MLIPAAPLLPVVLLSLPSAEGGFRAFLALWAGATTISLIFDVVDVWKYVAGRRNAFG